MDSRPNRTTGAMTLAVVLVVGYPAAMVLAFLLAGGHPAKSSASADAAHGATIYHECMICRSLDKTGIGPRHQCVFGRKPAVCPDYNYTTALKGLNIVWNETCPFRKWHPGWIGRVGQNHHIILDDDCDPSHALDFRR